jgi:hypothetical protein
VTHNFTKYIILAVSALGLSALPAAADSQCPTGVALSTYVVSGFTCFIGDLDFSNFSYTSSASMPPTPVPDTSVTVATVDNAAGIGFSFNSSWTAAGAGEFSDAAIGFTVSVIGGGPATLEDAALIQTGAVDNTNSGSLASVGENGCSGSSNGLDCSQMWSLVTSQTSNSSATSAHTFYLPTGSLTVSKDITAVDGSSANAFASVSLVQDTFSQVPEPRALAMLLGLGLIAGLGLKKKLQGVQQS